MKFYEFHCAERVIIVWEHDEELAKEVAVAALEEIGKATDDLELVSVMDASKSNLIYIGKVDD